MQVCTKFICVPTIATVVYWAVWLLRSAFKDSEKFRRLIPLISALLGAAFGLAAYYLVPTIIPADNVVTAVMVGGASGLSATGAHQIVKQLMKKDDALPAPSFEENNGNPFEENGEGAMKEEPLSGGVDTELSEKIDPPNEP